ncbi:hypothetical protein JOC33_003480 [Thalassobacillus pellis]|nr:hypothetical protein [Thalassobacillus pellis]
MAADMDPVREVIRIFTGHQEEAETDSEEPEQSEE